MKNETLEAIDIGRRGNDGWLLREVSLEVAPGRTLALVGPTGSGKTLLLRALAMLEVVQTGEVRWQGQVIQGNDVPQFRSRVMYLHQRPALVEGTVLDNLREPYALRVHRDKRFDEPEIVSWLKSLGRSADFLVKQQGDLSGGEAQLTALLRMLQLKPDVLLLDEPTSALDAGATTAIESLVAAWLSQQPKKRSAVWVTHDLQQAQRVATATLEICDGRLTGTGA